MQQGLTVKNPFEMKYATKSKNNKLYLHWRNSKSGFDWCKQHLPRWSNLVVNLYKISRILWLCFQTMESSGTIVGFPLGHKQRTGFMCLILRLTLTFLRSHFWTNGSKNTQNVHKPINPFRQQSFIVIQSEPYIIETVCLSQFTFKHKFKSKYDSTIFLLPVEVRETSMCVSVEEKEVIAHARRRDNITSQHSHPMTSISRSIPHLYPYVSWVPHSFYQLSNT